MSLLGCARLALLGVGLVLVPLGVKAKEPHPLQGTLSPSRARAEVGKSLRFRLSLESATPFAVVEVTLEAPEGMKLLSGPRTSRLRGLVPGKPQRLEWRLRVRRQGEQRLWARAKVLGLNAEVIERPFLAVVNEAARDPVHEPTYRVDAKGERLRVQDVTSGK